MGFPDTFPFTLDTTDLAVPPECEIQPIDIGEDAISRLIGEFRGKPRLEGVVRALMRGAQDYFNAALETYIGHWIDIAEGVQLDELGQVIDLPRAGWVDETYRKMLKAQILVEGSEGVWFDTLRILRAIGLVAIEVADVQFAAGLVTLDEPMPDSIGGQDAFQLLERARPGGVRLTLEFPTDEIDAAFTFSDAATPSVDVARGFGDSVAGLVGGELACGLASTRTVTS